MFRDPVMCHSDPVLASIMIQIGSQPARIAEGVYEHCGFNLHNAIERGTSDPYFYDDKLPSYGVVDSVEQFMELFGEEIRGRSEPYCVGFTEVRREDQSPEGGWQWHKWGEYFGKHEITRDYLYDEPAVEAVLTFELIRLTPRSSR